MKYALVLVLAFMMPGAEAQTIARKAIFRKGQQFEMYNTTKSDLVFEIMGFKREVSNKVNAMGTEQRYDSDSAELGNPVLRETMMRDVGRNQKVLINKMGEIIRSDDTVANSDELAAMGGNVLSFANTSKHPGQNYSIIAPLQKKPVRTGDEWTDSVNIYHQCKWHV